jgi:hypothetical protein
MFYIDICAIYKSKQTRIKTSKSVEVLYYNVKSYKKCMSRDKNGEAHGFIYIHIKDVYRYNTRLPMLHERAVDQWMMICQLYGVGSVRVTHPP